MTENTTTELPADWAIERALKEGNCEQITLQRVKDYPNSYPIIITLARYIEKHEQPPVDPWLLQARELAADVADELNEAENRDGYRAGDYDDDPEVQAIAAALRAAYEKGKADA